MKYNLGEQENEIVSLNEIKIGFRIEGDDYELVIGKNQTSVCLSLRDEGETNVALDDIVFIEPDSIGKSAQSNNKRIHFRNRKSAVLPNFTARTDIQGKLNLDKTEFVEIFRGVYVNVHANGSFNGRVLNVECMNDETGMLETVGLKVSKGKVNRVKRVFSK
ncbi:MAG: hypothetical protein IKP45_03380 [Bacteroidales bacterium]|nr:hypothetical protein [Bacteroidales bacterium]